MKTILLITLVFGSSAFANLCESNIREYYEFEMQDNDFVSVGNSYKITTKNNSSVRVYEVSSEQFGGYGIDEVYTTNESDCKILSQENIYTE